MERDATMSHEPRHDRIYSRRAILRMAPLAMAAGVALSVVSRRLIGRRRNSAVLPKDSIFTPARDGANRS
jgi:hypothetical protein